MGTSNKILATIGVIRKVDDHQNIDVELNELLSNIQGKFGEIEDIINDYPDCFFLEYSKNYGYRLGWHINALKQILHSPGK